MQWRIYSFFLGDDGYQKNQSVKLSGKYDQLFFMYSNDRYCGGG